MVGRAYLSRGALLWVFARAAFGALLLMFSASPIRFSADTSLALIAIVSLLSYIQMQRHGERNLLYNLGVPAILIIAISAIPPIVAESAIDIVQSLAK